ncbi:MAG: hypothetical protein JNG89_18245, partial [Planctomycetaceae bacterium]|nr:hypothetical protein [Planctomycetaceae bacterium]
PEFNERAWAVASDVILQALPLPEIEDAPAVVVTPVYQGDVAEVYVSQGSRMLTYVLHSGRNGMQVDDVLLPVTGRPNSLKANIELLAPLYGFALGIHHHDMELLKKTSGTGLARMVWAHTPSVPDIGVRVNDYLTLPIRTIKTADNRSLVEFSDGQRSARAILVREGRRIVVQDVQFEAGKGENQKVDFLQAMRDVLAERNRVAGGGINIPGGVSNGSPAPSGVIQAGGPVPRLTSRPQVSPAGFEMPADSRTR